MYATNIGDVLSALAIYPVNQALSATANSTGFDLQGAVSGNPSTATNYEGQIAFIADVKNVSGTTPTLAYKLQESDDNSTFTDVTNGGFTSLTTVASLQKVVVNKDSLKRYVRVAFTLGGTSPVYAVSVIAVAVKKNPA